MAAEAFRLARRRETVVISPHLDDAVFGCGQWLAAHRGATVLTVFAGAPQDLDQLRDWDRRCGFRSAGEAVRARRVEDEHALALLGARARWLDFSDGQYREPTDKAAVAAALLHELKTRQAERVLFPLGLFDADHRLVHEASLQVLGELRGVRSWAYEDCMYRCLGGALQERLATLREARVRATPAPVEVADHTSLKAAAVKAYASQLKAFGAKGFADTQRPERYWKLVATQEGPGRPAELQRASSLAPTPSAA